MLELGGSFVNSWLHSRKLYGARTVHEWTANARIGRVIREFVAIFAVPFDAGGLSINLSNLSGELMIIAGRISWSPIGAKMPLFTDATGNDLTYRIIGAAMAVHNEIGYGFKEEVYEKALEAKLNHEGICVERQYRVIVEYEGQQVAIFYLDLFAEGRVVIEIKAFRHQLTNDELAQVINYLKATGAPVALLFNFGRRKLEYRRIFPGRDMKPVQRLGRDDVIRP